MYDRLIALEYTVGQPGRRMSEQRLAIRNQEDRIDEINQDMRKLEENNEEA